MPLIIYQPVLPSGKETAEASLRFSTGCRLVCCRCTGTTFDALATSSLLHARSPLARHHMQPLIGSCFSSSSPSSLFSWRPFKIYYALFRKAPRTAAHRSM